MPSDEIIRVANGKAMVVDNTVRVLAGFVIFITAQGLPLLFGKGDVIVPALLTRLAGTGCFKVGSRVKLSVLDQVENEQFAREGKEWLLRYLFNGYASFSRDRDQLGSRSIPNRLARFMIYLADHYGIRDGSDTLLPLSHRGIFATMIGTSAETVIRIISRWEKEGLLEKEGLKIRLTEENITHLSQLAEPRRQKGGGHR